MEFILYSWKITLRKIILVKRKEIFQLLFYFQNLEFQLCIISPLIYALQATFFSTRLSLTFIIVSENLNAGNWFCLLIPSLIRINSRKHCRGRFNFKYKCKVNYIFSIIPNLISNFLIKTAADGLFLVILIASEKEK